MDKTEFKVIDGVLLKYLVKGSTIMKVRKSRFHICILVKNPKGSEWAYSEFARDQEPGVNYTFTLYADYNHSPAKTLQAFEETVHMLRGLDERKFEEKNKIDAELQCIRASAPDSEHCRKSNKLN